MNGYFLSSAQAITASQFLCNHVPNYLQTLQQFRLKHLISYAKKNSAFYNNKFQHISDNSFSIKNIPITTKSELMENFNIWVTDKDVNFSSAKKYCLDKTLIGNLYHGKYLIFESSGTSGTPGIFLHDLKSVYLYQALEVFRKASHSLFGQFFSHLLQQERIAYIGALNGHYPSTAAIQFNQICHPALAFIVRQISIYENYTNLTKMLNDYSPTIIATYPSMALSLAELVKSHQLKIQPREIWLGGENLDRPQKSYIESNLNTKVLNSYGSSEFPPIAWECDSGKLHVNADWIVLEGVQKDYSLTPVGEFSNSCLITNLSNTIQPFIRYELGDQIRFHGFDCACGNKFPTIDIRGRSSDILQIKDRLGNTVNIPSIELNTLLEEYGFFNFLIKQGANCDLTIYLSTFSNALIENCSQIIARFLQERNLVLPNIKVCKQIKYKHKRHSGKLINSVKMSAS